MEVPLCECLLSFWPTLWTVPLLPNVIVMKSGLSKVRLKVWLWLRIAWSLKEMPTHTHPMLIWIIWGCPASLARVREDLCAYLQVAGSEDGRGLLSLPPTYPAGSWPANTDAFTNMHFCNPEIFVIKAFSALSGGYSGYSRWVVAVWDTGMSLTLSHCI